MRIAAEILGRLLTSAERANARQGKPRGIVVTPATLPEYFGRVTAAELDEGHAELLDAERKGAIALEWHKRAGDRGQLKRVEIVDAEQVAKILGRKPAWELLKEAQSQLEPWRARPQVQAILDRWAAHEAVRGRSVGDVAGFIDALRVLDQLAVAPAGVDRSLRRFSANVFRDSKRIDALYVELDLLTQDVGSTQPRGEDELFADLGLLVHPQPFLLSGNRLTAHVVGHGTLPVISPYVGIPPQYVEAVSGSIDYVLTVENLDVFHELALGSAGEVRGLLMYTPGMPSPAWRGAYARVLAALPHDTTVLHWGDTDRGGVRILEKLYQVASGAGRTVSPWRMGVEAPAMAAGAPQLRRISTADARRLVTISMQYGWNDLASYFRDNVETFEQQSQSLALPVMRLFGRAPLVSGLSSK